MSQEQKALYQERAELCLQAARKADEVAAELYLQIQAEETPDPMVHDHWLEMVSSSAFWTQEWLSYLDMIQALETPTKVLFVNDENEDELTTEELAMSAGEFLASHEE